VVSSLVIPPPTNSAGKAKSFDTVEREAVYRAIESRRDVRRGFLPGPLPEDVLARILAAAHSAPSVGLMQPWRFIVVRSREVRTEIHAAFQEANQKAAEIYEQQRREQYTSLKLEGILEAPLNLCVVCDPQSEQGHGLGRQSMPETAIYSSVCAVQNLWLAARVEGVGVGWVSILSPPELRRILGIPSQIVPIAYLCLGFVDNFGDSPELERVGWERRAPLEKVVFHDHYGEGAENHES
jgi:5,6-dimethylbenzimidazole synthase